MMEQLFFPEHLKSIIELARGIFVNTVHAASLPIVDPSQNLGVFIKSIYSYSIGIVGLAVFVQFLRAGFTYFLAAGNASETGHAKEMMQNAILGGLLLLSSYLILNIINPDLTKVDLFEVAKLPPAPSVIVGDAFNPRLNPGVREVLNDDEARELLRKNGISVKPGVSLQGVRRATVEALIKVFFDCRRSSQIGTCDSWTVIRSTDAREGTRSASQEAYKNGFAIGFIGDEDLFDYFKKNNNFVCSGEWAQPGTECRDRTTGTLYNILDTPANFPNPFDFNWEIKIQ